MFIFLWALSGILQAIFIWLLDKKIMNNRELEWCPTPRAILLILLGALPGPFLIFGVIGAVFAFALTREVFENWFTRPICRRKKND